MGYMRRLVGEPHNNITLDPGQWTMTLEQEREFLRRAAADVDGIFLVAEIGGKIVGAANMSRGKKPTARHTAALGISVDAAYRRQGICTALMVRLIEWAKGQGLRRVELKVFTRNPGAIALYEKLGFAREGLHRMAFLKQGRWVDEFTMALLLPEAGEGGDPALHAVEPS